MRAQLGRTSPKVGRMSHLMKAQLGGFVRAVFRQDRAGETNFDKLQTRESKR